MIATLLATAVCAVSGQGEMLLPDRSADCTPGEARSLTRQEACTPKTRAHVPIDRKRAILAKQGLTLTTFEGKFDHYFPHWAGGTDSAKNLWGYEGKPPFPKDRLESYARHRYCEKKNLSMATIRKWFKGDWRSRWRYYDKRNWP